ncbi:hypothetical protein TSOC_000620 [Tetrabaena socialis]|uniref:Uncharacterized protein n=1 Tax=Tetrabaena socialis TaxID=47790 RepID=A0A2J8AJ19_9CHLO|nr:hypothetical protein TSOC_000620 [Tetrabaena socialis]|eukprot:PNH12504.1 hypothetical protein TSOC_000620 [Tetrabaena socialis]
MAAANAAAVHLLGVVVAARRHDILPRPAAPLAPSDRRAAAGRTHTTDSAAAANAAITTVASSISCPADHSPAAWQRSGSDAAEEGAATACRSLHPSTKLVICGGKACRG